MDDYYRWVPVTEALPESNGKYLATVIDDLGRRKLEVVSYITNGMFYWWDGIPSDYQVLAWAYLPRPWEAGKEEE